MKIILASGSPRRKDIMEQLGYEFSIHPSDADESIPEDVDYQEIASELAERKAIAIGKKHPESLVLGFDTLVFHNQNAMGKPESADHIHEMLGKLSDTTHEVITGVVLVHNNQVVQKAYELTRVCFKMLTKADIDNYIITKEPFGKAGSYAIQGKGAAFVKSIEGCFYNVVGLPVYKTQKMIETFLESNNAGSK